MALVTKNDVTQIFAIQAPEIDLPPTFANYPRGWDTARSNNGKPTIKQFNYIQQRTDQNLLWIHQNGAALPYDAAMEYAVGVVTLKDGRFKQWNGTIWINFGQDDNALKSANNLSDVPNKTTARNNLEVYSKIEVDTAISSAIPGDVPNATETVAGKAKIATTAMAQAGVNDTDIITPKKLANTRKSVWSNKTGRLFGTTYVNSSLFDRDLSVISQDTSQGYVTIRCVFIDLITLVETTVFFGAHANYSNPTIASAVFTIPAQTSYKISVVDTISNATKTATVLKWSERDYA